MSTSININDHDALDAAFAERVAGWVKFEPPPSLAGFMLPYTHFDGDGMPRVCVAPFTRSMDAVLPWLERENFEAWHYLDSRMGSRWRVEVGEEVVYAPTLPHAAVVALLRAKGVTVEEDADKP